jgi:hypothetical protein
LLLILGLAHDKSFQLAAAVVVLPVSLLPSQLS